jgi:5-hydroxyisourate hydrolase
MGLSTHVLDITRGKPAEGVRVTVERRHPQGFLPIADGTTDTDGRVKALLESVEDGIYRISFDVKGHLQKHHGGGFYPEVQIVFEVLAPNEHYHVPLLLSPYGYSTYRGS